MLMQPVGLFERELEAAKREASGLPPDPDDDEGRDGEGEDDPFLV